eukprot:CAMPEP_0170253380 /NCGR_PEP_ID=MMETSP0116_2-20130129/26529_1 /TAXON_ID=400756 /ORGANISM="Durinskia baltica, Strain CSIRO CS-38" /LENGTH=73 /DNA_ID=CAMNT_0010504361 /DNA_START=31 /DNA_END=252 /DNA_ORIENTATION=+
MTAPATSFWRVAGMTYLQYVNRAANSVRSAAKEPVRSKLLANSSFSYNAAKWEGGAQGTKTQISSLSKAGASL